MLWNAVAGPGFDLRGWGWGVDFVNGSGVVENHWKVLALEVKIKNEEIRRFGHTQIIGPRPLGGDPPPGSASMYCYVILFYVILYYVMLCCVYVMLCYVMLCYVMLCYVMLCYVMLCYVMLCYVMCEISFKMRIYTFGYFRSLYMTSRWHNRGDFKFTHSPNYENNNNTNLTKTWTSSNITPYFLQSWTVPQLSIMIIYNNLNPIDKSYIVRWQSDLENTKDRPLHKPSHDQSKSTALGGVWDFAERYIAFDV